MTGLNDNDAVLHDAAKKMRAEWERTLEVWNDKARAHFEKDFLNELDPAVKGAENALAEIRRLLEQAIKECS